MNAIYLKFIRALHNFRQSGSKQICRSIILLCLTGVPAASLLARETTGKDVQRTLSKLDGNIAKRDYYKQRRQAAIDSINTLRHNMTPGTPEWFDAIMEVAKGYSSFSNDSALIYYTIGYDKAVDMGIDSLANQFRACRATYLSISGYINDAIDEFKGIDTTHMSNNQQVTYLTAARQMYSYISNYYDKTSDTHDYWQNLATETQKKLLDKLNPQSIDYQLNLGEYLYQTREYNRAAKVLEKLIATLPPTHQVYPIATHILANIAAIHGDNNSYLYYLAESAIADTQRGTMEVTSIQDLGGILFRNGDTQRAHDYLVMAMNNVIDSHSSVRLNHVSELLAIIEKEHLDQIHRWHTRMYIVMAVLSIVLLALVAATFQIFRQLRRTQQIKEHLAEANVTKEVYIGQFLTLCSIYMDKLKQFTKLTNRKISAGQVDDLYKITKSNKFIEEQSKEFYEVFDNAFLHIYPSFVEKVNMLLQADKQIVLQEGELLNTDLRILAFMRLGIDDTARVAQILNYSVNTIYAYRNRLRNNAIDRENFEKEIMKISN